MKRLQINKDQLQEMYVKQKLTIPEIADKLGIGKTTVHRRLKEYNIPLKLYSTKGKYKSSDKYGINYYAILNHLGPCPGKITDYHIDHIIPLSAFDLNDPRQIKLAFAPENHQWLTVKENLSKHAQYDQQVLQALLSA